MTVSARVVCDSVSPTGKRLLSVGVTAHRFILAEINTHRVLSRSYRSSRAVPSKRLIEEVRTNPAMPIYWGANEKGMQASGLLPAVRDGFDLATWQTEEEHTGWGGEFTNSSPLERAQFAWRTAARNAANSADDMTKCGLHKQIANRVLEPFLWVHGIITATEWDNFFGLRLHEAAQPEFRALADAIWKATKESTPKVIEPGEWHLPWADDEETKQAICLHLWLTKGNEKVRFSDHLKEGEGDGARLARIVSAARCARSSYHSFETGRRSTIEEDLATYAKLNLPGTDGHDPSIPIHASPAEHQGTPCGAPGGENEYYYQQGNLVGWRQFRKMLSGEAVAPLPAEYKEAK